MKLIAKNTDIDYLNSMQVLLEQNGIPAKVSGENTTLKGMSYVQGESSLWVYLDEQSEDASNLIENSNYQVASGVDVEQFYAERRSISDSRIKTIFRFGIAALFVFLGIFILLKILGGAAL